MFFNNKLLFLIIQFIFCIFLVYFINQQIIFMGILDNFFIDSAILYVLIILISGFLSKILTIIYMIFSRLINHKVYKQFISWTFFTVICYILTFIIFAITIEY